MQVTCFINPDEENGYLSNWYPSRFACDGVAYSSMEQFMMHRKALLFGDERVASLILSSEDPAEIKQLGREVSGYDDTTWNGARQIVRTARSSVHDSAFRRCAVPRCGGAAPMS
ncbi:MAG: NADAR family protein [Olsenella sp.]|nr:NADAR family protein [Olsenella sp.]